MNIPVYLRDECYSEGLVIITEAAQKFDPAKQIPLSHWLAKKIHWSLSTWLAKQHPAIPLQDLTKSPQTRISSFDELSAALTLTDKILTARERQVLLLLGYGFSGVEVGRKLNIRPVQVTRTKQTAQAKMEIFREEILNI